MREGEPEGLCHGAALLVGLVEGGVEVGQQLIAHLDGTPPSICHRLPQIKLLHTLEQLNTSCQVLFLNSSLVCSGSACTLAALRVWHFAGPCCSSVQGVAPCSVETAVM